MFQVYLVFSIYSKMMHKLLQICSEWWHLVPGLPSEKWAKTVGEIIKTLYVKLYKIDNETSVLFCPLHFFNEQIKDFL